MYASIASSERGFYDAIVGDRSLLPRQSLEEEVQSCFWKDASRSIADTLGALAHGMASAPRVAKAYANTFKEGQKREFVKYGVWSSTAGMGIKYGLLYSFNDDIQGSLGYIGSAMVVGLGVGLAKDFTVYRIHHKDQFDEGQVSGKKWAKFKGKDLLAGIPFRGIGGAAMGGFYALGMPIWAAEFVGSKVGGLAKFTVSAEIHESTMYGKSEEDSPFKKARDWARNAVRPHDFEYEPEKARLELINQHNRAQAEAYSASVLRNHMF